MNHSLKIVTIIGARPQFIKASTVSRAIAAHNQKLKTKNQKPITEVILHTGQHFDANMSQVFFDELEIPKPDYNLGIGGGRHGQNTGRMIEKIEEVLLKERPDWVLVYGDTDSTLAGALAAAKQHIPVAHVEAGLRSYNRRMPEEINRIVADQLSTILFCPTETAISNLKAEGFPHRLSNSFQKPKTTNQQLLTNVGDVMYDAALFYAAKAEQRSKIIQNLSLTPNNYVLATVHRAENTDDPARLTAIIEGLAKVAEKMPVILPLHPRTRRKLDSLDPKLIAHFSSLISLISPLGYLDMVALEKNAAVIATDSGGVQKEAYFHGVPCVTLREETEWVELVELGWNRLAPPGTADIAKVVQDAAGQTGAESAPYGNGDAAGKVVEILVTTFSAIKPLKNANQ